MKRKVISVFIQDKYHKKIKLFIATRKYSIGHIIEAALYLFFMLDEKQKIQTLRESSTGTQGPGEGTQTEA